MCPYFNLCASLCLFFSIIKHGNGFSSFDEQVCHTPLREQGKCVQITLCPELYNLLQRRPIPPETVNYLRQSQCGQEGNKPTVCCYKPTSISDQTSNRFSSATSVPGKVVSHLLPDTETCGLHFYNLHHGMVNALIYEYPWSALLEYEHPLGRGFHCGGTLISNRYVLTAAHCISSMPDSWNLVSVRLGENNLNSPIDCDPHPHVCANSPIDVAVETVVVHEHFDPDDISQINDIALVRFNRNIIYTDFIRPICLATSPEILDDIDIGARLYTAGWGLINEERSHSSNKLKDVVKLRSYDECSEVYNTIGVSTTDKLCVQEEECSADTGGSLVALRHTSGFNWFAVGVKSFGPTPCGNRNWPGVYTEVTKHIGWIVDHLKP